jgi:hypothetical protein
VTTTNERPPWWATATLAKDGLLMSDYGTSVRLSPARLWSGGVATAVVAALVAIVGLLIARGILHVAVLAPKGEGVWANAGTATYAIVSALAALLATGLLHLLMLTTPRAVEFFTWIMVLLTLIAVVLPLSLVADLGSKITTGLINLVIGISIVAILRSVMGSAVRLESGPGQGGGGDRDYSQTIPFDDPPL